MAALSVFRFQSFCQCFSTSKKEFLLNPGCVQFIAIKSLVKVQNLDKAYENQ